MSTVPVFLRDTTLPNEKLKLLPKVIVLRKESLTETSTTTDDKDERNVNGCPLNRLPLCPPSQSIPVQKKKKFREK